MKFNRPALQQGFTLIELVIVITIIAALAAFALPRNIALQKEARVAKMQGLFGSVRTAAALAKARCELDLAAVVPGGSCTATAGSVNMDGTVVTMVYRYPTADATGITSAAGLELGSDGLTPVGGGAGAGASISFQAAAASDAATCAINYAAPTAAGVAPTVSLVTTGC